MTYIPHQSDKNNILTKKLHYKVQNKEDESDDNNNDKRE
jgi:hypothetical protein